MVIIRNIASGPFKGARSANGAQGSMNFIAGESWLATNGSAGKFPALVVELKAFRLPKSRRDFLRCHPSLYQKRSPFCRKSTVDAEPALCARQEPA